MTVNSENLLRIVLDSSHAEISLCDEDDHTYDEDMDDEKSIIEDACSLLGRSSGLRFIVIGFSDEPWRVDVETDLAVVLEQLPNAVKALRENREATIDFYEQGIERTLAMSGQTGAVEVQCASRHATWEPHPASISIKREALLAMLVQLGTDFCDVLRKACGDLSAHPWMAEWRRGLGPTSPSAEGSS